jgi:peptidoglycan/LPS O-acetylase OafA/YrhL
MSASSSVDLRRPPLDACTGLRFFAAMGVVAYHLYCPPCEPGVPTLPGKLFQAGFTTVSLFFILSGFILAYNYLGARGGFVGTVRGFYRARFARLYPIYLLALVVDVPLFIRSISMSDPAATAGEVARISVATLTLTQAWLELGRPTWNIVAWTLSAEAFFYLLFPLVGPWLARQGSRRLLGVAAGAWLLAVLPCVAAEVRVDGAWGSALHLLGQVPSQLVPLARLPEFVVGICLGLLFCRRAAPGSARWRTVGLLGTAAAVVALILVLPPKPAPIPQMALLMPLYALTVWLLAGGVAWKSLGLETRSLKLLGGASYALYLLHGTMMNYALALNTRTLTLPHNVVALLLVPLAVAVSILLFKTVEEPGREWLRHLGRARTPAASLRAS